MAKDTQLLPATDTEIGFYSITRDGKQHRHALAGWQVSPDSEPLPVLYPAVSKDARLLCHIGNGSNCCFRDHETGKTYKNLIDVLGD